MKKLVLLPLLLLLVFFSFSSCEKDESLDPRPLLVNGQFMRLDITKDRFDATSAATMATTSFGGSLTNPSGTVVRYELYVRVTIGGILQSDYVPYDVLTSFPQELSITPAKVQQAYADAGITIPALTAGNQIRFIGVSYDSAGNRAAYGNLSRTVQTSPGYKQAYRFNLECKTNLTEEVNNYEP